MHHLPVGTVTLLFTDIEGSTRLLQQVGEHYTDLLAEYRHLLRAAFHQWNGNVVDTQGDAFFVAFARATDAVAAAVAAQASGFGKERAAAQRSPLRPCSTALIIASAP